MAGKNSAGILVYRIHNGVLQVLIAHPGGPIWAKRDEHAWSIFKGVQDPDEELFETAKREFQEESGQPLPDVPLIALGDMTRSGSKVIHAWAVEQDYDPKDLHSNSFEMEWPPKSGKQQEFPENDRAEWFDAALASYKLSWGQQVFVERLAAELRKQGRDFELGNADDGDKPQSSLF